MGTDHAPSGLTGRLWVMAEPVLPQRSRNRSRVPAPSLAPVHVHPAPQARVRKAGGPRAPQSATWVAPEHPGPPSPPPACLGRAGVRLHLTCPHCSSFLPRFVAVSFIAKRTPRAQRPVLLECASKTLRGFPSQFLFCLPLHLVGVFFLISKVEEI